LRAGVAAFVDKAATALRTATGKSIEVRRVTLDVSISFDRRRPVGNSAGNGPARRHGDHDMARVGRRAPIAKGVTAKADPAASISPDAIRSRCTTRASS
jgi:hypothetical protein